MRELLEKNQIVSIVPKNFHDANKGAVVDISPDSFEMEVKYDPRGILINNFCEFYSQTRNGVLYFESSIKEIKGNTIKVANPIKHKFLQRRKFTRIKFIQKINLTFGDGIFGIETLDLSAGGMKIKSDKSLDIEPEYKVTISLSDDQEVKCKFQLIRMEKTDAGYYILSGRFKALSNIDKMTLIQFCMKKNMENTNK